MLGKLFRRLAGKSQAGPAVQAATLAGASAVQDASGSSGHAGRGAGKIRGIDWWIFILMSLLLAIGLVMVLSASGADDVPYLLQVPEGAQPGMRIS